MRSAFFIICLCFSTLAPAQDNPVDIPLSFFDGKAVNPYQDVPAQQRTIARLGIRSCSIYDLNSNDTAERNAYKYLTEQFSPLGIRWTHDPWLGGSFKGFTRADYNKNKSIASLQYRIITTLGCGTGGVAIHDQLFRTDYTYNTSGKLTLERYGLDADTSGKRFRTLVYDYNKKGLLTSLKDFYPPADTGDTLHMDDYLYRYDTRDRLIQAYQINKNYNDKAADSLAWLPDDFGDRLLRQSYSWRDSVLLQEFHGTYMDLINDNEDTSDAVKQVLEKREDTDLALIDIYTARARGFTAYRYNEKGLLVRRLAFVHDDLGYKDDFNYDDKDRLVHWQSLQLEESYKDFESSRPHEPVKIIWNFEYTADGRVARCIQLRYESRTQAAANADDQVFPAATIVYTPSYNADGTVHSIHSSAVKKDWPQQEERDFLIQYEFY